MTGKLQGPETVAADGLAAAREATQRAFEALNQSPPRNSGPSSEPSAPEWESSPEDTLWWKACGYGYFWGSRAAFGLTWDETATYVRQIRGQKIQLYEAKLELNKDPEAWLLQAKKELLATNEKEVEREWRRYWKVAFTKELFEIEQQRWQVPSSGMHYENMMKMQEKKNEALATTIHCTKCNRPTDLLDIIEALEALEKTVPIKGAQGGTWLQTIRMVQFLKFLSPFERVNNPLKRPEEFDAVWPEIDASDILRYGGQKPASYSEVWAQKLGWIPPAGEIYEDASRSWHFPADGSPQDHSGPLYAWEYLSPSNYDDGQARQVATQLAKASQFINYCTACMAAYGPEPVRTNTPPRSGRSKLPPRLRFQVLKRDNFRCKFCGRGETDGVKLHIDHIIPVANGGSDDEDNLHTLCDECNLGKGTSEIVD